MLSNLAIVIPAYKIKFIKETLDSIANQTCKDFTVYIGDDASPHDFREIINCYKDKLNLEYTRFKTNLGCVDLVAQWNRCINLIRKEEWIWLFSDDDLMDKNCVEYFFRYIKNTPNCSLLHFNIDVIDSNNLNLYKSKHFPPYLTASEYFTQRLSSKLSSCVTAYIFKKNKFELVNKFEAFDLAWNSDDATWIKLSLDNGIQTIEGPHVKWRYSTENISSLSKEKSIVARKIKSNIEYLKWAKQFFIANNINYSAYNLKIFYWFLATIIYATALNFKEKRNFIVSGLNEISLNKLIYLSPIIWCYINLKSFLKNTIYFFSDELK